MGKDTDLDPYSPNACCIMDGVRCQGSDVVQIIWTNMKLTGNIPPEIGNLRNLGVL